MAYYSNYYDQDMGCNNMGYNMMDPRPCFERENFQMVQRPYYGAAPVGYRQDVRRREPPFDNYRRDYRQGGGYRDGRYGVAPMEEVFRRGDSPQWMDDGDRHGNRYRVDRRDNHGGQSYGHGHYLNLQDGQDFQDYHHHINHHSMMGVELYVPICCDKCERKLRKHLQYIDGVETITTDQTTKKVVVFGNVNPSHVLSRARRDKPESQFWNSLPASHWR